MPVKSFHTETGWAAALASIITLAMNWGIVGYMALRKDPGAVRLWGALGTNSTLAFFVLALIGTLCGAVAGLRLSRNWFVLCALCLGTFLLEYASS